MPGEEFLIPLAAGAASALFGGNQMSAEQRRQLRLQNNIAQRLYAEGTGVPGSSPQEMAALASQRAQLGEQQLQQRNQSYAALGANQGAGSLGDFLQNLGGLQTAQNMNLQSQHLMNSMAMRRQALLQASGVGMSAAQLANQQGPPNQLPQMFGQLASSLAYNQAMKAGIPKTGGTPGITPGVGAPGPATTQAFTPMASYGSWVPQGQGGLPANYWSQPGQGQNGLMAAGNEPGYGANAADNRARQASGLGFLYTTPQGLRF